MKTFKPLGALSCLIHHFFLQTSLSNLITPCLPPLYELLATIGVPIVVVLFIKYVSHVITRQRDLQNSGRGYEDAMRRADAETNHREFAIELSLWKRPPSSTLGNGLPHRAQLIHDHVPLSSPEASRLEKLPEEILSMIVSWLSKGDSEGAMAFFALRQVSRHFRRLTEGAEFKKHYFSTHICCKWCSGGHEDLPNPSRDPRNVRHCFEYNVPFPGLKTEIGKLMIRDLACKRCRRVRKAALLFKDHVITCKFQAFDSYPGSWSKCHPCGVEHPKACFASWQFARPRSTCIGRQGHIRLCCHKTITWDDIKTCIDEGQHSEDRVFLGSCDHEDHSAPCSEGQGPQVFATKLPGGMAVVLIFWRGNSGGDPSVFHSDGYLYKTKLKEAIQSIRQQGGRHMIPQRGVNAMGEWDSIAEIDGSESISPDLIKLRGGWASNDPGHPHVYSPFRTLKVACGHCEKEKGCIVMTYIRRICFDMPGTAGGGLPHDWFHAIDPTSYDYSGHYSIPETRRNTTYRSHYGEGMMISYPLVNKAIIKAERTRTTS